MRRIVHRTDGDMAQLLALLRSGSSSRPARLRSVWSGYLL